MQLPKANSPRSGLAFRQDGRANSKAKFWWLLIIAGVALKLFLTSQDGINPCKFDSRNYAQTAGYLFSSGDLSKMPSHRPGLPIIAAVVAQLGIPYKLYLEFLLCFNAAVAGVLVSRLMRSFWAGAILFVAVAFNPWFTENSQVFMTEPLVSVLILMQLVFGLQMMVRPIRDWTVWHAVFAGSASLLHVLSRNETAIVFLYWIAVAIVVLFRQRKTIFAVNFFKTWASAKIALIVVPVAMTVASTSVLKTYNYHKFGIAAQCATEGDGFVSLMEALYSIPPAEKIRYAPVTRQSLGLACDYSPILAKYRDRLMDSSLTAYQSGKASLGLDNEFGTWLNWHLFNCITGSFGQVDSEMKLAADEIRLAQSEGNLPRRATKYPISPYSDLWLGDVWGNFVDSLRYSLFVQKTDLSGYYKNSKARLAFDISLFDESLLRRRGLANSSGIAIAGTFANGVSVATEAVVCDQMGNLIASADVKMVASEPGAIFNCVLDAIEYTDTEEPLFVYLKSDSAQGELRTNRSQLHFRRFQFLRFQFEPVTDDPTKELPAESWNLQSHRLSVGVDAVKEKTKRQLADNYHWLLIGCWATAFLAGLLGQFTRSQFLDVVWVGVAAIVFVAVRCLMYSLIQAWLLWGLYRYVEPNNLIFIVGIACVSFAIGGVVRSVLFREASLKDAALPSAD